MRCLRRWRGSPCRVDRTLQKWYIQVEWSVEYLNAIVEAEFDALPRDLQSRFERLVLSIRDNGLTSLREPHVKHLEGELWEMRLKGKDGIARAIYVTRTGRRVVVVRIFVKKTEKIPRREIDLAARRAKEVL
jgi:phage-related protein